MASEPELHTQNSQLCSLCTLGDKSQWTWLYFVTMIVACVVYMLKSILDMTRNTSLSDSISINVVVSFVACIVAAVVIPSASADDHTCQTFKKQSIAGEKHNSASILLI